MYIITIMGLGEVCCCQDPQPASPEMQPMSLRHDGGLGSKYPLKGIYWNIYIYIGYPLKGKYRNM